MVMAKHHLWISGISGKMGEELRGLLQRETHPYTLLGGTSEVSGWEEFAAQLANIHHLIDFSTPGANLQLLQAMETATGSCRTVLIGTTGVEKTILSRWQKLAKEKGLAVLYAPNTSLGISLALKAALAIIDPCFENNFDIEIEETHHRHKKDAPSGTALFLAENLAAMLPEKLEVVTHRQGERQSNQIGVHALRGGGVFGEHSIRFLGDDEELTIAHRAFSRTVFARGALVLSGWLAKQEKGFYKLSDVKM